MVTQAYLLFLFFDKLFDAVYVGRGQIIAIRIDNCQLQVGKKVIFREKNWLKYKKLVINRRGLKQLLRKLQKGRCF